MTISKADAAINRAEARLTANQNLFGAGVIALMAPIIADEIAGGGVSWGDIIAALVSLAVMVYMLPIPAVIRDIMTKGTTEQRRAWTKRALRRPLRSWIYWLGAATSMAALVIPLVQDIRDALSHTSTP